MIEPRLVQPMHLDLFPVPVSVFNLGEQSREMNKQMIDDIMKEKNTSSYNILRSGINVWQSDYDLERRYEVFAQFKKDITPLVHQTLQRVGYGGNLDSYMKIEEFWANVDDTPHGFTAPHIHGVGNTAYAGVYYPTSGILNGKSLSENEHLGEPKNILEASSRPKPGAIVFLDPGGNTKSLVMPHREDFKRYPYYGLPFCITPREGTLVLFPAYLMHYVTPVEQENFTRISVAFSVSIMR